ncbi:MAG: hypothetical protein AAF533_13500 [Acidobacteriota bacterium]
MSRSGPGVHEHSGALGLAPVLLPTAGLVAAFVLAVVYAYICVYSPVAGYISLLFVLGFALGLAVVVATLAKLGKCRNRGFLALSGLGLGLFALYCSWAVFVYALLGKMDLVADEVTMVDSLLAPGSTWEVMKSLAVEGWYSVFGFTPSGFVLWLFWAIEAFLIVVIPALTGLGAISDEVFCEPCRCWCDRMKGTVRLAPPEAEGFIESLTPENLRPLTQLAPVPETATPQLRVDTWRCGECSDTAAVRLVSCTTEADEDGKVEEKDDELTPIWTVAPSTLDTLALHAQTPPQPMPMAPPA